MPQLYFYMDLAQLGKIRLYGGNQAFEVLEHYFNHASKDEG